MDDNIIISPGPQKSDIAADPVDNQKLNSDSTAKDSDSTTERIFDITPDMNIRPISDVSAASNPPAKPTDAKLPDIDLQTEIDKLIVQNQPPKKKVSSIEQDASALQNTPKASDLKPESQSPDATVKQQTGQQPQSQINKPLPKTIEATPMFSGIEQQTPILGTDPILKTNESTPVVPLIGQTKPVGIAPSPEKLAIGVENTEATDKITGSLNLKPIRTYEGDVAEAMALRRTSVASIAIAESQRNEGENKIENKKTSGAGKKLVVLLMSLILIVAGVTGAYYFYLQSPLAPKAPVTAVQSQAPSSIIPRDSYVVIPVDTMDASAIRSRINDEIAKPQIPNTIEEIILTTTQNGQAFRIGTQDLLNKMKLAPPDMLVRTLEPDWMIGIFSDANSQKHFFAVVTTNFFQDAFAGMLQWEKVMPDDLKQYISSPLVMGIADMQATSSSTTQKAKPASITGSTSALISTSTVSTSTNADKPATDIVQPNLTLTGQFQDRIIENKDVRAFVTDGGNTLFLYSFIDNQHLVVAGDDSTISEMLTRLEKQSFMR